MNGDSSLVGGEDETRGRSTGGGRPGRSPPPVPETLRSPSVKLVYLCLAVGGPQTPGLLRERLGLSLLTLYPLLGRLVDQGLVERVEGAYAIRDDDR
ncbi:hypothetical protein [Natronorarus salvus]|uniref:hypothetical protein n=1 Tax=Natronorarus salvus TaxID=3117733 RepID=UPI002F26A4AD